MDNNLKSHLEHISSNRSLPQNHINYLQSLKQNGFEPDVIYDIGSCVLHWTNEAKLIWPNAKIILFDAFSPAEFLYKDHDYHIGVLSDIDNKEVKFYQNDYFPTGNSYYRETGIFNGKSYFEPDSFIIRKAQTLDSIIKERGFPAPDLVKIDVQGCEYDIISGGKNNILNVKHLIVELQDTNYNDGAPKADITLPFIESLGFKCIAPKFSDNGPDADYGFIRI
jgi:FkbM family methyltransferase